MSPQLARPNSVHRRSSDRRALLLAATALVAGVLASLALAPPPASAKPGDAPPTAGGVLVALETSKGEILLELDPARAPRTVANFLQYVDDGFYDGTVFHRVIPTFMIQGGGFTQEADGALKPKRTRDPIVNEWNNGLRNDRGTIAMARLSAPDTATAQFFINVKDNPALNGSEARNQPGYAVFGKVVKGMEVVDAIKDVQTVRRGPHEAVPVEPVVITKARRVEAKKGE